MLGGLPSGPSFNDMSDFSLEASDEGDSPSSYGGGHKGLPFRSIAEIADLEMA